MAPQEKNFNKDGFMNKLDTDFIGLLSDMLEEHIHDIGEADITLAIRNSQAIANEIIQDKMLSPKNKIAFALISSATQSASRMRMMVNKMEDSLFKQELGPIMTVMGQAGMDFLHTPAHYASAFPGMALIGKLMMIACKIKKQASLSDIDKDEKESKVIDKFVWGIKEESESSNPGRFLIDFPKDIMYPGLGGIFMENNMQNYHMEWYEDYYSNVVTNTKYDRRWYSLVAADMHPFYKMMLDSEMSEGVSWSLKLMESKNKEMTMAILWDLLNQSINYTFRLTVEIGDMPVNRFRA
jgi:hypothetical protein